MRVVLWILSLFAAVSVSAHQNSIAYLFLEQTNGTLRGHWEIPVRDLEFTIGLDANKNGEVTWGEIKERLPAIRDYALPRVALRSGTDVLPLELTDLKINNRPAGAMVVLLWQTRLPPRSSVALQYNFGFDYDGGHQCILTFRDRTAVLTKDRSTFDLVDATESDASAPLATSFPAFVRTGVFHIYEGIDHICFLLALMLPAVSRRTANGWEAVRSFRAAFVSIAKIVTAFTIAHSITLAVAALRIVVLPSALVESVIAFSVVIAALNNLWPLWTDRSWMVAFAFGLIHGFGFASALSDLPAGAASLAISLAGFNIGVEIGQLSIVLVFLPLAFLLRDSWFYRWCAVRAGSVGIACVAAVWLVERAFQISIF